MKRNTNYARVTVHEDKILHPVSNTLFGIFLEDINYSCDGGLNANMVSNYSFDDVYIEKRGVGTMRMVLKLTGEIKRVADRLRHWNCFSGRMESRSEDGVVSNGWYARIYPEKNCRLENHGYNGSKKNKGKCAMSIREGKEYRISCFLRGEPKTQVSVWVANEKGQALTDEKVLNVGNEWQEQSALLTGMHTAYGKLVFEFPGGSYVDMDCVQFMDTDVWAKDDMRWSQGKMRRDLVQALYELKPAFVRFPGGCLVEGIETGNQYQWKNGIGPIIRRRQDFNLWASCVPEGDYTQSMQLGFYEFFLLCEDLGAEPLPVVWAGMYCQIRNRGEIPADSEQFQRDVVDNALDLIAYANGDPAVDPWAKCRAEAGHPEPFHMKYIAIGNENYGEDYLRRFEKISQEIHKKYPEIICILSAGMSPEGKNYDMAWNFARGSEHMIYIDEHFYKPPKWVRKHHTKYDSLSEKKAAVFLGEYAAKNAVAGKPNTYDSALAEAAFLTGVERNSDIVKMACYAPLFCLTEGNQWEHNLINFNPAYVQKTVNYYVQQMYANTVGTDVIQIETELPKEVYISATRTEHELIVKAVNVNAHEIELEITAEDLKKSEVHVWELQSNRIKAANSLSFNGTPQYVVQPRELNCHAEKNQLKTRMRKYSFYVFRFSV